MTVRRVAVTECTAIASVMPDILVRRVNSSVHHLSMESTARVSVDVVKRTQKYVIPELVIATVSLVTMAAIANAGVMMVTMAKGVDIDVSVDLEKCATL
jgi:hypothetical protein